MAKRPHALPVWEEDDLEPILPAELGQEVVAAVDDVAGLAQCALVCRAWAQWVAPRLATPPEWAHLSSPYREALMRAGLHWFPELPARARLVANTLTLRGLSYVALQWHGPGPDWRLLWHPMMTEQGTQWSFAIRIHKATQADVPPGFLATQAYLRQFDELGMAMYATARDMLKDAGMVIRASLALPVDHGT